MSNKVDASTSTSTTNRDWLKPPCLCDQCKGLQDKARVAVKRFTRLKLALLAVHDKHRITYLDDSSALFELMKKDADKYEDKVTVVEENSCEKSFQSYDTLIYYERINNYYEFVLKSIKESQ